MNKMSGSFLLTFFMLSNTVAQSDIKIGIYSGTFDPPTNAHEVIIRSAIKNLKLDKLYIFVNKSGEKTYKCSAKQRIEMLECMLKNLADIVIIIDQSTDKKYQDYLMLKKIINQPIIHITGQDSYERRLKIEFENRIKFDAIVIIPRGGTSQNLSLEKNAFYLPLTHEDFEIIKDVSSTKVRQQLAKKDFNDIALNKSVLSYIIEHNLYTPLPERAELFQHEYYAYVGKFLVKYPLPPFDPQSSIEAWEENFYKWIFVQQKGIA